MSYEELKLLDELRRKGTIGEEEYRQEKQKIFERMNNNHNYSADTLFFGLSENAYVAIMHIAQLAGYLIPFFGFIAPFVLWILHRDKSSKIDQAGKDIINFILTWLIYLAGAGILCIILIGIPVVIALVIMQFVFTILAAVKTSKGEYWKYPLTFSFLS
jgi:uncharacterized Tic20 family protein